MISKTGHLVACFTCTQTSDVLISDFLNFDSLTTSSVNQKFSAMFENLLWHFCGLISSIWVRYLKSKISES